MTKKRLALTLVVLALGLMAGGGSRAQTRPEVTEEFHQTYPLQPAGRVALSNINGRVRVTAWDRNEVRVDAVKRAYRAERLRDAEIVVNATGNSVEVETRYPENHWNGGHRERDDNPASVDYTLTVPRGALLDEIKLINGALEIEGVGGSVRASSINGALTARNLAGDVKLSVVNGGLDASFDRLGARVSLSSVNGGLIVRLPSDASAHLRASTVHGRITNDFGLPVREGKYVGRNLEGRLGAGGPRLELSNVNGAITIRRAADGRQLSPAVNLLSETPDGDFEALDDAVGGEIARAARDAARVRSEALQDAARDRRDAERARRDMERELRAAEREIEREGRAAARDAAREAAHDAGRPAVHAPRQIARESKSFPAGSAPRVRLETFDGPINVRAWNKPEVMYTAVKRAHNDREMQGIRVLAQAGPEIVIRAEFDKTHSHTVVERAGRVVVFNSGASVELDVYVPRRATLYVSTGDGPLNVTGVTGELELRTGDGPVTVTGGGGRVRANTGDGPIRVEGFDGEAEARTGDGRISLEGNFSRLAARTGDGSIWLALPEGVSADIETRATSVSNDGVAVAADGEAEGRRLRRWRVGAGGELFTLHTGDGQVILRRR